MLELFKFILDKLDFLAIAEALRKRNNRKAAARLHLILIQSYEIIELYRVLMDELRAAMLGHQRTDDGHRFSLNPWRIESLLKRQACNLEVMQILLYDLLDEVRVIDNRFAETYRSFFPGKAGILFEAGMLLEGSRLPISEGDSQHFPADSGGVQRTLWITGDKPKEEDRAVAHFRQGPDSGEQIVEVNIHDGDAFFRQLEWYFTTHNPHARLGEVERITESYKQALVANFSLEDILSDIGKVRKHDNWANARE